MIKTVSPLTLSPLGGYQVLHGSDFRSSICCLALPDWPMRREGQTPLPPLTAVLRPARLIGANITFSIQLLPKHGGIFRRTAQA